MHCCMCSHFFDGTVYISQFTPQKSEAPWSRCTWCSSPNRDHDRGGRISGMLDEFGSEDEEDRGRRRAQLGLREAAGGVGEGGVGEGDDDDDAEGEVNIFLWHYSARRVFYYNTQGEVLFVYNVDCRVSFFVVVPMLRARCLVS